MADYKVGETLKELRIHSGMTQEAISKELNISRQVYSYYESGRRLPDLQTACRMAGYLRITLDQLVVTGLHPANVDPFASLPEDYREIMRSYHELSLEGQRSLKEYLDFLKQKENNRKNNKCTGT